LHVEARLREAPLCMRLLWSNESLIYIRELQAFDRIRWLRYRLVQKMRRMDNNPPFSSLLEGRGRAVFFFALRSYPPPPILFYLRGLRTLFVCRSFAKLAADIVDRAGNCEDESRIRAGQDAAIIPRDAQFSETDTLSIDQIISDVSPRDLYNSLWSSQTCGSLGATKWYYLSYFYLFFYSG